MWEAPLRLRAGVLRSLPSSGRAGGAEEPGLRQQLHTSGCPQSRAPRYQRAAACALPRHRTHVDASSRVWHTDRRFKTDFQL